MIFRPRFFVDVTRFWHDETAYLAERSTMKFSVTVDRDEDGRNRGLSPVYCDHRGSSDYGTLPFTTQAVAA